MARFTFRNRVLERDESNTLFNIRDYGAKGDDSPGLDDTAAIQAAVNAAGPSGTVYVPGVSSVHGYQISTPINLPYSYQTLYGDRGALVQLKSGSNCVMFSSPNDGQLRNGLRIMGFACDGQAALQTGNSAIIDIFGMNDLIVNRMYLTNARGQAVRVGAAGTTCTNPFIYNNLIHGDQINTQNAGIDCESASSDAHIWGNDIGWHTLDGGILLSGHSGAELAENKCWQCKHGLFLFSSNRTEVVNHISDLSKVYGIVAQFCSDLLFSNCTARESSQLAANTYEGIHLEGSVGTPMQDVTLSACRSMGSQATYGLNLFAYVNNCSIVGGSYRGNQTAAANLIGTGVSAIRAVAAQGITDQ